MEFTEYGSKITSGSARRSQRENDAEVVTNVVEVLWTDAHLADKFMSREKGWDSHLARALNISTKRLKSAINSVGMESLREQVENHPSGGMLTAVRPGEKSPTLRADSVSCPGNTQAYCPGEQTPGNSAHYCPSGSGSGCCAPSSYMGCVTQLLPKYKM